MVITSRLLEPAWSPQQEAYIEWLALPKHNRIPKTELALARELGVDRTTLYNWRKLPALQEEVRWLWRSTMGSHLAEVLASVEESALSGSLPHQRLYFQLLGMIGPRREIDPPWEIDPPPRDLSKDYIGVDLNRVGRSDLYPDTKPVRAQAE